MTIPRTSLITNSRVDVVGDFFLNLRTIKPTQVMKPTAKIAAIVPMWLTF